MREWLKRLLYRRPVYFNGLDMYYVLEVQDEIRAAQKRGELTEDEVVFISYIKGVMGATASFLLMILCLLFVVIPIAARTNSKVVMVGLTFAYFFLTFFFPNRILHRTLMVQFTDPNSSIAVMRLIVKVGYVISWIFLSALFLLAIIFAVMLLTTLV